MTAPHALRELDAKRLLASVGVAVPASRLIYSVGEARSAAEAIGFPVVVKVASPDILHKSDVGGVALGVATAEQAGAAFEQVLGSARAARPEALVEAALVESSCPPGGVEVIVGLIRDPHFGPVVMVGLGGVLVEILGDVAFRVAPIDRVDALEMLGELRGAPLLDGARGRPPVDREALVGVLLAVAGPEGLAARNGEPAIPELDLNPVFAYPRGAVVADARIVLAPPTPTQAAPTQNDPGDLAETMRVVFAPRSIAVIGASTDPLKLGHRAVKNLVDFGYPGRLYPIHPLATEIFGRSAYPRLAEEPGPIERVIVTIASEQILGVVEECVQKGVRVAHVYTGGFGELDEAGRRLEQEMLARAAAGGLRIVGPNSIGTYAPAAGLSPIAGANPQAGHVSVVSQSGGLTYDTIRRGCYQDPRFSKAISIGNAVDLDPVDYLAYFAEDPDTRVIGAYIESVRDGGALRKALETGGRRKPVVILKGGQTGSGQRAAASHTGALAGDFAIWRGLFRQTGVSGVETIEELLDTLLGFQMLSSVEGTGVALIGPSGGASVTATDAAERQGLVVPPFAAHTVRALEALALPPGSSLVNPLDVPAGVLRVQEGRVLGQVLGHAAADPNVHALVVHLNLVPILALSTLDVTAGLVHTMVSAVLRLRTDTDRPLCLVLRSSGEPEHEEVVRAERERALAAGIPVYPSIDVAPRVLGHLAPYARFRARRAAP